jgi:hypothetical protein
MHSAVAAFVDGRMLPVITEPCKRRVQSQMVSLA